MRKEEKRREEGGGTRERRKVAPRRTFLVNSRCSFVNSAKKLVEYCIYFINTMCIKHMRLYIREREKEGKEEGRGSEIVLDGGKLRREEKERGEGIGRSQKREKEKGEKIRGGEIIRKRGRTRKEVDDVGREARGHRGGGGGS